MKAAFIVMQGALLADAPARFALRSGASEGLRRLAELDFRLIVLDRASASASASAICSASAIITTTSITSTHVGAAPIGDMPSQCDPPGWLQHQQHRPAQYQPGAALAHPQRRRSDGADRPHQQHGRRDTSRHQRITDLLFREQLPLQGFYGCAHAPPYQGPDPLLDRALPPSGSARPAHPGLNGAQDSRDQVVHASHPPAVGGSQLPGDRPPRQRPAATPAHARPCLPPQAMLLQMLKAAVEHKIDLRGSWLLGADLDAVEAGHRAGCRTVLIDNGTEKAWQLGRGRMPTRIAPDLPAAAILIIAEGQRMRLL